MDDIDKKISMLYDYVYSKSFKDNIESFEIATILSVNIIIKYMLLSK